MLPLDVNDNYAHALDSASASRMKRKMKLGLESQHQTMTRLRHSPLGLTTATIII